MKAQHTSAVEFAFAEGTGIGPDVEVDFVVTVKIGLVGERLATDITEEGLPSIVK